MGRLTTHVLDTARGIPAAGVAVSLYRANGERLVHVKDALTNRDGRCDTPLLDSEAFSAGRYRLSFAVGAYFAASGLALPDPPFVDVVTIDFGVADGSGHWHVPLLVSPWGWTTYRGS